MLEKAPKNTDSGRYSQGLNVAKRTATYKLYWLHRGPSVSMNSFSHRRTGNHTLVTSYGLQSQVVCFKVIRETSTYFNTVFSVIYFIKSHEEYILFL